MSELELLRVAVYGVSCAAYFGSICLWIALLDWFAERRTRRPVTGACVQAPEHTGGYRTNPRPQSTLPRKTPWRCRMGWHLWEYDRPVIRLGGYVSYKYACQRFGCCAIEDRW